MGLAPTVAAQTAAGTAFTYQGRLADAGTPANGPYDFRFILYDANAGGSQVGPIVTVDDAAVVDGLFTVGLDFGPGVFTGDARFLEIGVRPGASSGPYTVLGARQELKPAPHSVFSQEAPWTGISGKPPGFADDIDDDVLGGLVCANGQLAKWNGATWACAADTDTTYTAGAGLDLTGAAFSVANLGITTGMLASNAVTTAKVADSAVTSAKIADGTIGLADLGQNGCAPSQILKWSGAAWACAADVDTNSGGTVTSVGTGAGLTGGPISTTGTVSVANGGITTAFLADGAVTSPKIANGAVGLAQINTAQVQARVGGTCPPGQYLRGINPDGTVACDPFFAPNVITTVDDPANSVGQYTSIAIGTDGFPVISYWDNTAFSLKVAHCGNASCTTTGNALTTVDDPANFVGQYTSIAIGTDGFPVISYYDQTAQSLKVAHCGNASCTTGNTLTTVDDPANNVGLSPSIAIGTDGFPVISYYDQTAQSLKVAHCGNASCTTGNTLTTVDDPANDVGLSSSIAIGTDGFPVISYFDVTAGSLKVAHCGNTSCTTGNTLTTVDDPANNVGPYTSISIGTDGLPVISYRDQTAFSLKVAHCGNTSCTTGNTLATVDDPANEVGQYTSIAIGTDGLPVISYYDFTALALKVAKCATRTCQ